MQKQTQIKLIQWLLKLWLFIKIFLVFLVFQKLGWYAAIISAISLLIPIYFLFKIKK